MGDDDADTEDAEDLPYVDDDEGAEKVKDAKDAEDEDVEVEPVPNDHVFSGFDTELMELASDYESSPVPPPKKMKVTHRDQIKAAHGVSDMSKGTSKMPTAAPSTKKAANAAKSNSVLDAAKTIGKSNSTQNAMKPTAKSNATQNSTKAIAKSNTVQNLVDTVAKSNGKQKQAQKMTGMMSSAVAMLSGPGIVKDWKPTDRGSTTSWQGQSSGQSTSTRSGATSNSLRSIVSAMLTTQLSTPARPKPRPAYKGAASKDQLNVPKPTGVKVIEGGGITSKDEGTEQDVARSSPIKIGKRLTSSDVLRRHFTLTRLGLSSIPGLFDKDSGPIGAIGIAAAAASSLLLVYTGCGDLSSTFIGRATAQEWKHLAKSDNQRSGQKMNVETQFSEQKYGIKSTQYAHSASRMRHDKLQKVIDCITTPIVIADENDDEERAMLIDYSD
ncbi:hypothetical protein A0H81_08077 [Grifola frondosa]|uniref:Uncharacterized protein n=1 Tax=Grifola frondosa TaxID=5627 RepID=A0A1C7M4X2_GRIFR|nr:hypothetical protein A0H81_08077 [Grifola frondosa]